MLTGFVLLFFYDPSTRPVVYHGSYAPLRGVEMSGALQSTLAISFDVPGGLLVRQLHNWSSSLMIAALAVHILSVFFTGAFRRPRELLWLLLFGVLFLTMGAGLTGSVLPDDLLSTNSLAVLDGVLKAIPIVGTWLSSLVFQGRFPSGAIETFFPLHVVVLPLGIAGLVAAVAVLAIVHGPTRTRAARSARAGGRRHHLRHGGGALRGRVLRGRRRARRDRGARHREPCCDLRSVRPGQRLDGRGSGVVPRVPRRCAAARAVGVGDRVDGPHDHPRHPRAGGGLEPLPRRRRALAVRRAVHRERPATAALARLDRPRNAATRTALGVAAIVFYGVLWAAAGADTIAYVFHLGAESLIVTCSSR